MLSHHDLPMARTHATISQHLKPEVFNDANYVLRPRKWKGLEEVARNEDRDIGVKPYQEIAGLLIDRNYLVCVPQEDWDRMAHGEKVPVMNFFCVLSDRIFAQYKSVTILGAFFEETLNYEIWQTLFGTDFHKADMLEKKLRYTQHEDWGHRLTVACAFQAKWANNSKNEALTTGEEETRLSLVRKGAKELFGNDHFAWMANKRDDALGDPKNRIPNSPYGFKQTHISCGLRTSS